jgi:hypothetical protein
MNKLIGSFFFVLALFGMVGMLGDYTFAVFNAGVSLLVFYQFLFRYGANWIDLPIGVLFIAAASTSGYYALKQAEYDSVKAINDAGNIGVLDQLATSISSQNSNMMLYEVLIAVVAIFFLWIYSGVKKGSQNK